MYYKYYFNKICLCILWQKTSVRYLDSDSKRYLDVNIGCCDREIKYANHLNPKGSLSIVLSAYD
ncbi:hypothetical protein [Psychroserpens luteus]|uniref:Zinc beta-ribbon finger putative domain-containing protein n=1 Tax=Psychroserpens luteus TaxID=1434066 RepID=A0ABW5ZYP5_9FLAO